MTDILEHINNYIWGGGLIFLLLSTGIIYTVKLRFIQLKMPFLIMKKSRRNSGLSQVKTVCMSLGTTMGTGNITGAAAALAIGGAGSLFWMWVSAFLGMAVVYAENELSARYSDSRLKGPMAYLEKGLGCPALSVLFAIFCTLASFGMGGMVQVNTFADSLKSCCHISPPILFAIIFLLIFTIIRGGASRIGTAAQFLLPAASAAYTAVCIAVIAIYREKLPSVIDSIFSGAFSIRSAAGGTLGYALSVGIRRGIFSNEAGLGSSPILHSAAGDTDPETQGAWSMFEVFFDTIICCTLTAFTVLCGSENCDLTAALSSVTGSLTPPFLAAETGIFALCTVIGWYYCGETSFRRLSGSRYIGAYAVIYAAAAASGAVLEAKAVWTASDIFNGLMAFPNLLGLLLLINKVRKK